MDTTFTAIGLVTPSTLHQDPPARAQDRLHFPPQSRAVPQGNEPAENFRAEARALSPFAEATDRAQRAAHTVVGGLGGTATGVFAAAAVGAPLKFLDIIGDQSLIFATVGLGATGAVAGSIAGSAEMFMPAQPIRLQEIEGVGDIEMGRPDNTLPVDGSDGSDGSDESDISTYNMEDILSGSIGTIDPENQVIGEVIQEYSDLFPVQHRDENNNPPLVYTEFVFPDTR